jgi:hypothetical protein
MAKYAHPDVLDNGPAYIKANANLMALISGYAFGDSYATVNAAKLASVATVAGDYTLTNNVNDRRLATPASKSANATATSGASPDLHIAFLDTVNSKVLWVTDETSNQVITSGNPVDFPVVTYNSAQPV